MGVCALCRERLPKLAMARHLAACVPRHDRPGGAVSDLWHVRAEGRGSPLYWIDLEVRGDAPLRRLDEFLRHIWLECCGHVSAFEIGGQRYSVRVDREFGLGQVERSMAARISSALTPGQRFGYEYDFGSTTHLVLKVLGTRRGIPGRPPARLLARNEPPVWPCAVCGRPASVVCPYCVYEGSPFSCPEHIGDHACEEEEPFLPVVNSPRMGVCGYTG
jgi:Plasmid pRiA4b ORF-3-like protein